MILTVRPLGNRVLVEKDDAVQKRGLIHVPTSEKPLTGTILDVGEDVEEVQAGDHVMYRKHAGQEVKIVRGDEDVECLILDLKDVLGVITLVEPVVAEEKIETESAPLPA